MNAPQVTILIPVFNAGPLLREAVQSMLDQDFRNYELLLIDDGSTDGCLDYLAKDADPRIRIHHMPRNQGIVVAMNEGLRLASAPLLARMDADDVSLPTRLGRQVAYLAENPGVFGCGSQIEVWGREATPSWISHFTPEEIDAVLLFLNPICHPTMMMRTERLRELGGYPGDYPHAEEYALWARISRTDRLANLREPLLRYRVHEGQISQRKSEIQGQSMERIVCNRLAEFGIKPTAADLLVHRVLGHAFFPHPFLGSLLDAWIARLTEANRRCLRHEPALFERLLGQRREEALRRHRDILGSMNVLKRIRWRLNTLLRHRKA